jgi:hypothetical protein
MSDSTQRARTDRERATDRYWALKAKADSTNYQAERELLIAKAEELRHRFQLTNADFIRRGLIRERGPAHAQPPPQQQVIVVINGKGYPVPLGMDPQVYAQQLLAQMMQPRVYTSTGNASWAQWTFTVQ